MGQEEQEIQIVRGRNRYQLPGLTPRKLDEVGAFEGVVELPVEDLQGATQSLREFSAKKRIPPATQR